MTSEPALQTIAEALDWTLRRLQQAAIDEARMEARLLVAHALDLSPETVFGFPERKLDDRARRRLCEVVERRAGREPMAYITGRREFWSLDFALNAHTLIPRPDSETLIEAVLEAYPDADRERRILDLGTGSGCLLLALLHERRRWTGLGLDRSGPALEVAAANGAALGLTARSAFERFDWTGKSLAEFGMGPFDLIIANPPYIPDGDLPSLQPEVANFEPLGALLGGSEGLDAYRIIVPQLGSVLAPGGMVFLEVGKDQASAVGSILSQHGFAGIGERCDLGAIPRCVFASIEKQSRF